VHLDSTYPTLALPWLARPSATSGSGRRARRLTKAFPGPHQPVTAAGREATVGTALQGVGRERQDGLLGTVAYFIIFEQRRLCSPKRGRRTSTAQPMMQPRRYVHWPETRQKYLLAVGLTGAETLAVPVLTGSAAYSMAETFGWRSSWTRRWPERNRFTPSL